MRQAVNLHLTGAHKRRERRQEKTQWDHSGKDPRQNGQWFGLSQYRGWRWKQTGNTSCLFGPIKGSGCDTHALWSKHLSYNLIVFPQQTRAVIEKETLYNKMTKRKTVSQTNKTSNNIVDSEVFLIDKYDQTWAKII